MKRGGQRRREFLAQIARFAILGVATASLPKSSYGSSAPHQRRPFPGDLEPWVGKAFEYRAGCPLLEDFAWGQIRIHRAGSPEKLFVVMETRLEGIAGVVSLQRTDTLASLVMWASSQGRFVPIWHADQVARYGSWKRKVLVFEDGGMSCTEWRLSQEGARSRRVFGQNRPLDDPLSAFLNWRAGAYGPLRPGETMVIDNLARREPLLIRLQILPEEETRKRRPQDRSEWTFLMRAQVDREVAESLKGTLEGWLDSQWVVLFARATNVRIVGEAWARLTGKGDLREPNLPAPPEPPLSIGRWRA
jgi:hypothetical protein